MLVGPAEMATRSPLDAHSCRAQHARTLSLHWWNWLQTSPDHHCMHRPTQLLIQAKQDPRNAWLSFYLSISAMRRDCSNPMPAGRCGPPREPPTSGFALSSALIPIDRSSRISLASSASAFMRAYSGSTGYLPKSPGVCPP